MSCISLDFSSFSSTYSHLPAFPLPFLAPVTPINITTFLLAVFLLTFLLCVNIWWDSCTCVSPIMMIFSSYCSPSLLPPLPPGICFSLPCVIFISLVDSFFKWQELILSLLLHTILTLTEFPSGRRALPFSTSSVLQCSIIILTHSSMWSFSAAKYLLLRSLHCSSVFSPPCGVILFFVSFLLWIFILPSFLVFSFSFCSADPIWVE